MQGAILPDMPWSDLTFDDSRGGSSIAPANVWSWFRAFRLQFPEELHNAREMLVSFPKQSAGVLHLYGEHLCVTCL